MNDIVLIGSGIMSVTLAKMLKELNPDFKITILEALPSCGLESSSATNNAGTGHAGLCELNYTPYKDGKIDIHKAVETTEAFEMSRQFWSFLVNKHKIVPRTFIKTVPHVSFVKGKDIIFLGERWDAMKKHHFYKDMEFIGDYDKLLSIAPLLINGRESLNLPVAATYAPNGTDINYGRLTTLLAEILINDEIDIEYNTKVLDLRKSTNGKFWKIKTSKGIIGAKFVFIGAGGGSLTLLEKTGIPDIEGYGGFPISGMMLQCINPDIIQQHQIKAYGNAKVGSPPMSVAHLDTRWIDGQKHLIFGPFPGFSTKFLKYGSYLDLFKSIKLNNIYSMLLAGWNNIPLTKYLIREGSTSFKTKMKELQTYYPEADPKDWKLITAGQRVQIIKKDTKEGGVILFGTELVVAPDKTMVGLLGASPGASTSVHIMVDLIEKCFPEMKTIEWQTKMKEMIPSYGKSLAEDKDLYEEIVKNINDTLKIM